MSFRHFALAACLSATTFLLQGCAPNTSGSIYAPSDALQEQQVTMGTITHVRTVEIRALPGQSDRLAGAVIGGALGSAAGDELGNGDTFAIGAGAIVGALAGDAGARVINRSTAREWTVRTDHGASIAVIQNDPSLFVGQRVRIIRNGSRTRLAS